ncbi:HNH endonuclease [Desulfovibrio sp. TomC]|uniref:HNH endonuclease n=1 Tax=Desulfovibrio sp. TomC TaxID=1562888 RepID=UPI0009E22BCA|nr:HNH endonuclease [Desulfovibrio sp. TomC]
MNKKLLKVQLFAHGVQAYRNYSGSNGEYYCCPVCGDFFSEIDLENSRLTLEHVPPSSQGGKGIALTCSSCNNNAGHSIDAEVANREDVLKASALITRQGKFDGDVALNFGEENHKPLNFRLVVEEQKVRFYLKQKSNHPNARGVVESFFKEHNKKPCGNTSSIKFSTRRRYRSRFANIGYLKSAFLVCFAAFGYTYAFDKNLEIIRRQIICPNEKILEGYIIRSEVDFFEKRTLLFLENPTNAFAVLLNDTAVVLPLPSFVDNVDIYDFLVSTYATTSKIDFSGVRLEWPTSLSLRWDFERRP